MKKINTIWIIEDDPIQVFIAKRMLKNLGFTEGIRTMAKAKDALEELQALDGGKDSELPDILFVDINMPHMDGWQFLEEYDKLSIKKKVAIYLVTSSIDPVDLKKARTFESVNGYLTKPLKKEDLMGILEKHEGRNDTLS